MDDPMAKLLATDAEARELDTRIRYYSEEILATLDRRHELQEARRTAMESLRGRKFHVELIERGKR